MHVNASDVIQVPFPRLELVTSSNRMSVYRQNRDGQICYEELVLAVLQSVQLPDVTELKAPFKASASPKNVEKV